MTTEETVRDAAAVREAAAGVVHGVYRLVKACLFHVDATNDAVTSLTTSAATAVRDFCQHAGSERVIVTFLGDAVFVNGQILKASRDTHALATGLGEMLATCEVSELTFAAGVREDALVAFGKLLADIHRDRSMAPRLLAGGIRGIGAGKASFGGAGSARDESPSARAARTYATALVTVQRVFSDLRAGKFELPRRIKRVAQRIVAHADEDARLLVALAASAGATVDPAALAVSSAIFAVAMTRQLTSDRALLANAATAALLHDAGRLVASGSQGALRSLNEDELDRVPARSVVTLTAIGRLHAPARARTALVYEVWSQRRAHRIGALYGGRRPATLVARILGVARAFSELRAAGADAALTIDDAIQVLVNRAADGTERALVKLLVGALGIYPAGTLVELSTGELAVVMATPAMPVDYVRPPVKILYDTHANLLDEPIDLDLAAPRPRGAPLRFIRRNIDADDQQAMAMRSFVIGAKAAKRRAALEPEPPSARATAHAPPANRRIDPRAESDEQAPPSSSARLPNHSAVTVPAPPRRSIELLLEPAALAPQPPPSTTGVPMMPAKRAPPAHLAGPAVRIREAHRPLPRNDSQPPAAQEEHVLPGPIALPRPPTPAKPLHPGGAETAHAARPNHDDLLAAFLADADAPLEKDPDKR